MLGLAGVAYRKTLHSISPSWLQIRTSVRFISPQLASTLKDMYSKLSLSKKIPLRLLMMTLMARFEVSHNPWLWLPRGAVMRIWTWTFSKEGMPVFDCWAMASWIMRLQWSSTVPFSSFRPGSGSGIVRQTTDSVWEADTSPMIRLGADANRSCLTGHRGAGSAAAGSARIPFTASRR